MRTPLSLRTLPALALALSLPNLAGAEEQEPVAELRTWVSTLPRARVVLRAGARAYLGVALVDITGELREFYGAPADAGVLVSLVSEDSPAAEAGFRVGDVITEVGGDAVANAGEVVRAVARLEPEEQVRVAVVRSGAPLTLSATLGEREGRGWSFFGPGGPDGDAFHLLSGELPRVVFDEDEFEETVRSAIEEARERMSEVDFGALAERLAEAEDRLRELERKLAEREPGEPES